jgi:hypothetical protein
MAEHRLYECPKCGRRWQLPSDWYLRYYGAPARNHAPRVPDVALVVAYDRVCDGTPVALKEPS